MKRFLILWITVVSFLHTTAQALPRPKLVVGLVVDQMRWDYLYRYYDRYETGGFRRLLNEGFSCENTFINYVATKTAVGHTSIYTGTVPAIHGITGNDFIIQSTGKSLYCTEDTTVTSVGSTSAYGKMSPRNMLVNTITDELKLATNFRSKTIGVSLKDRGAILAAGHLANAAYWLDDKTGDWISSSFYMNELPAWLKQFNSEKRTDKYLAQDWINLYPLNTYKQSWNDDSPYESKFKGQQTPVFPIKLASYVAQHGYNLIRTTPFGNTLTLDLAKVIVDKEQMGQRGETDFLAISLSSTDYIGHHFSPNAIEVEDAYLRLDKDIASFLNYLDKKIGKGAYTLFLSADHGGAHNPRFLLEKKMPAGLWPEAKLRNELNSILEKKFGKKNLVLNFSNYQVNFNNQLIEAENIDIDTLKAACINFLEKQAGVALVVDLENINRRAIPDELRNVIANGYNRERCGPLQILLQPAWYSSGNPKATGTSHGVWNPYDAHIPLVWMGWGIRKGQTNQQVSITDITPTLAALLRIQTPNGTIGKPIQEVLK